MAQNFFVHFVDDVAAAGEPYWVMELHIAVVHTLADSVALASPLRHKNFVNLNSDLNIIEHLPSQLERNATTARSRVLYSYC